ncbi:MAG: hypothetical protein IJ072_01630 [Oscillospiraceae bacterium]|nr:hypothetical protein [Oscillospiraceae bacterium]
MDRIALKEAVRNTCPNIRPLRKMLSKYRLHEIDKYAAVEKEVRVFSGEDITLEEKRAIVERCRSKFPEDVKKIEIKAKALLCAASAYKERAADDDVMADLLFSYFAMGFSPAEYIYLHVENRTIADRKTFLTDREKDRCHVIVNDLVDSGVFSDKAKTYKRFAAQFGRDAVEVNGAGDFAAFESFVKKHPVFVSKRVYSSRGKGVNKIDIAGDHRSVREIFDEMVSGGKHLCEELVIQSPETQVFNSSSVNSIRLVSAYTRNGIEFPYAFFRMGRSGSFVDNAGSGGISCGVNTANGVFDTIGYDEYGTGYASHPDSGVKFMGFQLPAWQELIALATELSLQLPTVKMIGWDFAYSSRGWVIIEGNPLGELGVVQLPYQAGIKQGVKDILGRMDLMVHDYDL